MYLFLFSVIYLQCLNSVSVFFLLWVLIGMFVCLSLGHGQSGHAQPQNKRTRGNWTDAARNVWSWYEKYVLLCSSFTQLHLKNYFKCPLDPRASLVLSL